MRQNIHPFVEYGGIEHQSHRLRERLDHTRYVRNQIRDERLLFGCISRSLAAVLILIAIFACIVVACVVPPNILFW